MEIQLTDFENAAFAVFIVLVTRAISAFSATLYLPLSKTDENMKRAHARDAVHTQKFYFRNNHAADSDGTCSEMTINEIINGKVD
jgi:glutamate--cysteine ligase catalytic subunit